MKTPTIQVVHKQASTIMCPDCREWGGVVRQYIRYANQWQKAHGEFEVGDGRSLILANAERAMGKFD